MDDRQKQRIRICGEIEEYGRDRIIRLILKKDDPFTMYGLLDTLHISSPENIDLIVAFLTLRGRGFRLEDLQAGKKRARSYLQRVVGDAPEAGRPLRTENRRCRQTVEFAAGTNLRAGASF